jgi:hypothetical protein
MGQAAETPVKDRLLAVEDPSIEYGDQREDV